MSTTGNGPFDWMPTRDITVRKRGHIWEIGCADCFAFGGAPTWAAAMATANAHARDEHGLIAHYHHAARRNA